MTIRLQEMHPAIVHLPISLMPVAITADALGRATGNRGLLETGRRTIQVAAISSALSGASGFIAQEEVNADGEALDILITHRNINVAATIVAGLMAVWRSRRYRPSLGYLALGLADIGALTFTAYLGGTMVYRHGVGVKRAGGQYRENPPELGAAGETGAFARDAAGDLVRGVKRLGQELAQRKFLPLLTDWRAARGAAVAERDESAATV